MKKASKYKELTGNKGLLYTIKYEEDHPIIMGKIEAGIMSAVEEGQYNVGLEMSMLSAYDITMINKVLAYYGFSSNWTAIENSNESCQSGILNIYWA